MTKSYHRPSRRCAVLPIGIENVAFLPHTRIVKFEFDPEKSRINQKKHGVDFIEAQKLWRGSYVEIPARNESERRKLVIGSIAGKHYSAIVTHRSGATRIISVRRAREDEKEIYRHYQREKP